MAQHATQKPARQKCQFKLFNIRPREGHVYTWSVSILRAILLPYLVMFEDDMEKVLMCGVRSSGLRMDFSMGASTSKGSLALRHRLLTGRGSSEWWAGRGAEKKYGWRSAWKKMIVKMKRFRGTIYYSVNFLGFLFSFSWYISVIKTRDTIIFPDSIS